MVSLACKVQIRINESQSLTLFEPQIRWTTPFVTTVCSLLILIGCFHFFINSQPLEITLHNCDFNKEAALDLLQAVGDCRLSLTIMHQNMYVFN